MKQIELYLLHFFIYSNKKNMLLLALLPLIAHSIPYILGGLDYLRRQLLPSAPDTQAVANNYVPPFTGGQCVGVSYAISYRITDTLGNVRFYTGNGGSTSINPPSWDKAFIIEQSGQRFLGVITSGNATYANSGNTGVVSFRNTVIFTTNGAIGSLSIFRVERVDGQADSCGNLPNPSPSPSIGDDGIATSPSPNPNNFIPLITGIAAATAAGILAAKAAAAAALAAAKAAAIGGNVAGAIAELAKALAEILKLLDELEKEEDEEKEEETVSKYDFGKVEKDGFIKLYPDTNTEKQKLSYIDLQVVELPSYLGKYFGQNSPHYYRYKSLGYVSYVSPTFGVLETRQVDFKRLSLYPPENAMGFFYHFGLDGKIKVNITGFYTKKPVPPPAPPA